MGKGQITYYSCGTQESDEELSSLHYVDDSGVHLRAHPGGAQDDLERRGGGEDCE